jgi:non-heme chloroperoxidase
MRTLWQIASILFVVSGGIAAHPTEAQAGVRDGFLLTRDGVRLHYLEAGPATGQTIVLVPGWTMPAWIWAPQIAAFSRKYHVIAFDPRGQGESDVPAYGYTPARRGQDIAELIARLRGPVLLVGWSLGVLDSLAYLHMYGDAAIAGLVLVDNSVGEEPAPLPGPPVPRISHARFMARFVRGMFHVPQPASYLDRLTEASLRTPEPASRALLAYPVPRAYWREALYATDRPLLYVVRPRFAAQAANVQRMRPNTETVVFPNAGHALFVDEPTRFDAVVEEFMRERVWR